MPRPRQAAACIVVSWSREATLRTLDRDDGRVEFWHETVDVALPRVTSNTVTRNLDTGEQTCDTDVLAFRDADALRASLVDAGFELVHLYGDWSGRSVADGSAEIIAVARRTSAESG